MARKRVSRRPPDRFAWFFGYHVFDLQKAREFLERKPSLILTTVNIEPLLGDGVTDLDLARQSNPREIAIIARVPCGYGRERYVLIDGFEVAHRCAKRGLPLRLIVLSKREAASCRVTAESSGDWPEDIEVV